MGYDLLTTGAVADRDDVVVAVVGCEARLHHLVLSRPASRGGHIVDGRTVG